MSAKKVTNKLWDEGLKVRREVLGAEYVDASVAKANDFQMAFQHITTEFCWGYAWTRPGLSRKTRSLLNLAMLTALNRSAEIKLHVLGALNNGVTVEEIKETLLHATVYCGIPAGLDAFKAANQVLTEQGAYDKKPAKKKASNKPAAAPTKKAAAKTAKATKTAAKAATKAASS